MYFSYIFFIRIVFYPFIRFILPLFSKRVKNRVDFEFKNYTQLSAHTSASYGFEISSEGELEQVKPVLDYLLENKYSVEIIYCSSSVEHRVEELIKKYPLQLRSLRLPMITFNPFSPNKNAAKWLTAKTKTSSCSNF